MVFLFCRFLLVFDQKFHSDIVYNYFLMLKLVELNADEDRNKGFAKKKRELVQKRGICSTSGSGIFGLSLLLIFVQNYHPNFVLI